MSRPLARLVLFGALLGACGAPAGAPARAASPPSKPATTTAAPSSKTAATIALEAAEKAIPKGDWAAAKAKIDEARRVAPPESPEQTRAVLLETALHTYQHDYEGAARVLVEHLKVTSTRTDQPTAFYEHNWLSILRQAQGDLLGALVEADARTRFGEAGSWPPPSDQPGGDRATQTKLKETWHRAYLLRMIAEQTSGTRKEATIAYAEEARRAYASIAHPLGRYEDSIAVLEAFFAMHDGDLPRARAAAKRVDPAKNDDVEDLYLVYGALDAAGDKESAAAVRKRIEGVTYVSFGVPIVRAWIEHDSEPGPKRFSPRYPSGRPQSSTPKTP